MEQIPDYRTRDAVMIYAVKILDLSGYELAHVARLVYSPSFLVSLLRIRIELGNEKEDFYSLNVLQGIEAPPGEDEETLGYKLVELIDEYLEEFRKPDQP